MPVFTEGVSPWNQDDNNIRLPTPEEMQDGFPCGDADIQLFNFIAAYAWGQIHNFMLDKGSVPDLTDLTQLTQLLNSLVAFAGVVDIRAGTDTDKALNVKNTLDANAPVLLTDAPNIAIDFATGIVFSVTLEDNRIMDNPTNQIAGQNGILLIKQDGMGDRTLSFDSNWRFLGGAPTLSPGADMTDLVAYYVEAPGTVRASFIGGM